MSGADITLEDLGLELPSSGRGRRPAALHAEYSRDLTAQDVSEVLKGEALDVRTPSLQQIRHTHHNLARLLAEGRKQAECAAITGFSPSRISILMKDPAFAELVAYYGEMQEEIYRNVHERLSALSVDALEIIQERLEKSSDSIPFGQIMQLAEMTLDRSGHGPKSTVQHDVHLETSQILEEVRNEVTSRREGSIKTLELSARPNAPSEGSGTTASPQAPRTTNAHSASKVVAHPSAGKNFREERGEVPPEEGT